ncbi:MAG: SH3 domain-containing protein [Clostridia bacterium]|nr:SH3 domain-containing protein [Clostridia bacterium]
MNKRILSLVAVMALMMTMFAFATPAFARSAPTSNYYAYSFCSNGKALNVRSGPGKEYDVIGKIPYGEQLMVSENLGNGWAEIYWGSVPGFVMTSLITDQQPGPYVAPTVPAATSDNPTADVNYNALFQIAKQVEPYTVTLVATANSKNLANIRWAPDKKSTLLDSVVSGTEGTIIAQLGKNWYQVQLPSGAVGFVNTAYVQK